MKNEPVKDTSAFNCYDQFLITQYITEKQNGVIERIGSLTMCARRFLTPKPAYVVDFMQTLNHSLPECHTCCRELTSFRKSIRIDWTKTKLTKEKARQWISEQVRKGCVDFEYGSGFKGNKEMLPNPTVPGFGDNPNRNIEPIENEMTF